MDLDLSTAVCQISRNFVKPMLRYRRLGDYRNTSVPSSDGFELSQSRRADVALIMMLGMTAACGALMLFGGLGVGVFAICHL